MRATKVHTNGTREHGRTGTNQLRRSQLKGIGSAIRHDASRGRATLSGDARLEEKQLKDKGIQFLERQRMMDPATWCVNYEEEEEEGGGGGGGGGEEGEEAEAEGAAEEEAEQAGGGSEAAAGGGGGSGGGSCSGDSEGHAGSGGSCAAAAAAAAGSSSSSSSSKEQLPAALPRPQGGVTTSQGVHSAVSGAALQELLSKAKAGNNLRLGGKVLVAVSSEFAAPQRQ